ncbi:CitB family two-component system sensor histidine kinase CitS [Lysinibacillus composti]|uniref:histidine kinase n=1 Tax=Lysinibacillus composti TaxID=720633 RepID=A0A3N9UBJ8_9BACI|nr:sensor histidine kinase [Lysinibacillus composti]MBM7610628.1 CitB family two-component system sensor histidine kinase CitS [Lysinibacillus composti]RQW73757.1 sensor histidine kinase [Lysinibacillus composti]
MNKKRIPLQTKILGLISTLILFIVFLLASIFAYMQYTDAKAQVKQLALQSALTISLMPELKESIKGNELETRFRPIAEQVIDQVNAENIIIENWEEIIYSHTNPGQVGKENFDHTNKHALIFGGSNNFEVERERGGVLIGKVPIIEDNGEYTHVVGTVSVEFLKKDIYQNIYSRIKTILIASLIVLILGIIGGIFLSKSIRKDTMGLEPHEISSLYKERSAILLSVKEGIIAFDRNGLLTLINHSAKSMLNLSREDFIGQHIQFVLSNIKIDDVLQKGKSIHNAEVVISDKVFIFNFIPIIESEDVVGVVSSFRDKTELKKLIDTISEVREYSEGLRAQTHEYANKLYLLSGLIQLERYQDAFEFIQKESTIHQHQNRILFNQIHDINVQAILLGKLGKASEKKITLEIDANSYVDPLPSHIEVTDIITIIGNLIDNAFDAIALQQEKKVSFSITGIGNDIIIEVTDNGKGIPEDLLDSLFSIGYSSKGKNRGYGLFNVKHIVESLNGMIEVNNGENGGAIFTIYLPKKV